MPGLVFVSSDGLRGCRTAQQVGQLSLARDTNDRTSFYISGRFFTNAVEHIAALLSPDLEWTGAESFPYYSGLWRGPQAVIDNLLLPLARDWDGFSATRTNFSLAERFWIT